MPDSGCLRFWWLVALAVHPPPPRSAVCDSLCSGGLVWLCWAPGPNPHGKGAHVRSHQFKPPIHPPPSLLRSKLRPLPAELRPGSSLKQLAVKTADGADPVKAFTGEQSPVPTKHLGSPPPGRDTKASGKQARPTARSVQAPSPNSSLWGWQQGPGHTGGQLPAPLCGRFNVERAGNRDPSSLAGAVREPTKLGFSNSRRSLARCLHEPPPHTAPQPHG